MFHQKLNISVQNKKKLNKILIFCFICIFSSLVFNCVMSDYMAITEIKIENESSYNLQIIFEEIHPFIGFEGEFDVSKGESESFTITSGLGGKFIKPRNPNSEIINVKIINLDTNEIIIEKDNMGNDTIFFEYIRGKEYHSWYIFKITDDFDWSSK